jgi:hypothetical protein
MITQGSEGTDDVIDPTGATWRKSSRSNNGQGCVEVATNLLGREGVVLVRDSKNPSAGFFAFTPAEWDAFVGGVRDGEFDL